MAGAVRDAGTRARTYGGRGMRQRRGRGSCAARVAGGNGPGLCARVAGATRAGLSPRRFFPIPAIFKAPRAPTPHQAYSDAMKALGQTSITALILGTGTAIYAAMTWPHWDGVTAYTNAMTITGSPYDAATAAHYMIAPEGLYTPSLIGLSTGLTLVGIGILAGLLAMHANQITAASSITKAPPESSSLTLPPPTEIFPEALPETK